MDKVVKFKILESCWKDSLNWTFELIDILKEANEGKTKIVDLDKSKKILSLKKEEIIEKRKNILSKIEGLNISVKPAINFLNSLEKLLNSTEIDFSKIMKMPPKRFDLFESIDNENLTNEELSRYLQFVKQSLENRWVAFNQNYGRLLIKLKVNDYDFE